LLLPQCLVLLRPLLLLLQGLLMAAVLAGP
jgi:hypothetical protein